jgi:hypothetical protein
MILVQFIGALLVVERNIHIACFWMGAKKNYPASYNHGSCMIHTFSMP